MLLNWEKSIPGLYFMLMLMLGFYEASSNQSIPCIAASLDYAQTKTHNLQFFKIMERFQCKRGKNYFTANSFIKICTTFKVHFQIDQCAHRVRSLGRLVFIYERFLKPCEDLVKAVNVVNVE